MDHYRGASQLDADAIALALGGSRLGRVDVRASTGSTNEDALELMGDPANMGLTICADHQARGVGRKAGRSWIAPAGSSLLMTTILPAHVPASQLWTIPFWAGVCAYDAIEAEIGEPPRLRWPNDVLIDGKKCAGILCVSRISGDAARVGCGIGINVLRPNDDGALDGIGAAFLSDYSDGAARLSLLVRLLQTYEAYWTLLERPRELVAAWELRAHLAVAPYRITLDETGEEFVGQALRLGPDGTLVVRHEGVERIVALADATIL